MGQQSRARTQRREAARRMAMAVDNGWVMPTPPAPPRWPLATATLIAGLLVGAVATAAAIIAWGFRG